MRVRSSTTAACGLGLALAAGCAFPAAETEPGAPPAVAAADTVEADRPPAAGADRALGFLGWEELSVRMVGEGATAGLRIDITTLDDEAVALAADDVRTYLEDMKTRIPDAVPAHARDMRAFLVAFSGFEKEVRFDPSRLQLRSEGSSYYPRYVVPASPEFDRRLVGLYQTVYAIYLFDASIDLRATLEFQYDNLTTGGAWRGVVERIERARPRGRG